MHLVAKLRELQASIPTRQRGSASKNASIWLRRSCFRTTTFRVDSMNLEHILSDIQTNRCNLHIEAPAPSLIFS
jgi:hypothetical protein